MPPQHRREAKILIVDDESTVIEILRRILVDRGYERIESTTDPLEALGLYERFQPDLIVLDLMMPGLEGLDVLGLLRAAIPPESFLPILVVTGATCIETRRRALAGGANDYVMKPYDPSEIMLRVGNLLETRLLHLQLAARNSELLTEVGQRREAEAALQATTESAERANLAKSDFLSRMSHELRTPLNSILGFAQLLEIDARDGGTAENVSQILRGGRHLLGLINEVLDISAIEAGRLSVAPEPLLLGRSLEEAVDLLRPLAAKRRVQLGGLVCARRVLADPQRLKQVLLNLLSNAIKFCRTGGSVTLTVGERAGGRLRLMVRDEGAGIAPKDLLKVFTPFERLGAAEMKIEGSGLGLAISKRLVELMGGSIGVESVPGEGSTFWIELPLAKGVPEPADSRVVEEVRPVFQAQRTLLYIEDNAANFKLMEHVFHLRPSVKLLGAVCGRRGLEMAIEHHPDLVLLDLNLPDLNGDEVLAQLQADPRTASIPVVMVSGDAIPSQAKRLMAAGARHYVTKPFDLKQFLGVIDDLLQPILLPQTPQLGHS